MIDCFLISVCLKQQPINCLFDPSLVGPIVTFPVFPTARNLTLIVQADMLRMVRVVGRAKNADSHPTVSTTARPLLTPPAMTPRPAPVRTLRHKLLLEHGQMKKAAAQICPVL